jgi:hypothetical protein
MDESNKFTSVGDMYWSHFGGEYSVESNVYETTPVTGQDISLRQNTYRVLAIRRVGDIPRFEIIDFVVDKNHVVTISAPLEEVIFSTEDTIEPDTQMIVAVGRRTERGYPLRFHCTPEFYKFLTDCKNGFMVAYNNLIK